MEACSVAYVSSICPCATGSITRKNSHARILGRTDASMDSPEWNDFVNAIKGFSTDWSAVCNRSNSVDLVEAQGQARGPFAPLVEKMDRAITTSGAAATRHHERPQAAGASLQADESDILEADDAQMIGETLTAQVSRHVLQYHLATRPSSRISKSAPREKGNRPGPEGGSIPRRIRRARFRFGTPSNATTALRPNPATRFETVAPSRRRFHCFAEAPLNQGTPPTHRMKPLKIPSPPSKVSPSPTKLPSRTTAGRSSLRFGDYPARPSFARRMVPCKNSPPSSALDRPPPI